MDSRWPSSFPPLLDIFSLQNLRPNYTVLKPGRSFLFISDVFGPFQCIIIAVFSDKYSFKRTYQLTRRGRNTDFCQFRWNCYFYQNWYFCQIITFLNVETFINCFYTFINIWYSCELLVFSWTLWLKYQLVVPVNCNFADCMREFQIVFKYCYSNRLTCFPKQAWNFAIKYSKHGTWINWWKAFVVFLQDRSGIGID